MNEYVQHTEHDEVLPEEHAALAALADGSLEPHRAAALRIRVAESPELSAALDRQLRAVALVRCAAARTFAPPALRERLESGGNSDSAGRL